MWPSEAIITIAPPIRVGGVGVSWNSQPDPDWGESGLQRSDQGGFDGGRMARADHEKRKAKGGVDQAEGDHEKDVRPSIPARVAKGTIARGAQMAERVPAARVGAGVAAGDQDHAGDGQDHAEGHEVADQRAVVAKTDHDGGPCQRQGGGGDAGAAGGFLQDQPAEEGGDEGQRGVDDGDMGDGGVPRLPTNSSIARPEHSA
jgi:hypothetical protein